jgi:hypothetical protein
MIDWSHTGSSEHLTSDINIVHINRRVMPDFDIDPATGGIIPKVATPQTTSDFTSTSNAIPPPPPVGVAIVPKVEEKKDPLSNLIDIAKQSNESLNKSKELTDDLNKSKLLTDDAVNQAKSDDPMKVILEDALIAINIGQKLLAHKDDIISIFKNNGMDTMSQKKAWDQLIELLTLEK